MQHFSTEYFHARYNVVVSLKYNFRVQIFASEYYFQTLLNFRCQSNQSSLFV